MVLLNERLNVACPWPLIPPNCTELLSSDPRSGYDTWQRIFLVFGISGLLICVLMLNNCVFQGTKFQRIVYPFLALVPICFIVRSIDPAGEGNILSFAFFAFAEAISDASLLTAIFLCCALFFNMSRGLMAPGCLSKHVNTVTLSCSLLIWVSFMVIAFVTSRDPGRDLNFEFGIILCFTAGVVIFNVSYVYMVALPMEKKMRIILLRQQQQLQLKRIGGSNNGAGVSSGRATLYLELEDDEDGADGSGLQRSSLSAMMTGSKPFDECSRGNRRNAGAGTSSSSSSSHTSATGGRGHEFGLEGGKSERAPKPKSPNRNLVAAREMATEVHSLFSFFLCCSPLRRAWESNTKIMKTVIVIMTWAATCVLVLGLLVALCFYKGYKRHPFENRYFDAFRVISILEFVTFLLLAWVFYIPRREEDEDGEYSEEDDSEEATVSTDLPPVTQQQMRTEELHESSFKDSSGAPVSPFFCTTTLDTLWSRESEDGGSSSSGRGEKKRKHSSSRPITRQTTTESTSGGQQQQLASESQREPLGDVEKGEPQQRHGGDSGPYCHQQSVYHSDNGRRHRRSSSASWSPSCSFCSSETPTSRAAGAVARGVPSWSPTDKASPSNTYYL